MELKNLKLTIWAILLSATTFSQTVDWGIAMGCNSFIIGGKSAVDKDGNIFVVGLFGGTTDFDPSGNTEFRHCVGNAALFIAKYDEDGHLIWVINYTHLKSGNYSNYHQPFLVLDDNGDVYIASNFNRTIDFDPGIGNYIITPRGDFDGFLLKLGGNGEFKWVNQLKSSDDNSISSIAILNGELVIGGNFQQTADFVNQTDSVHFSANQQWTSFLAKVSQNGVLLSFIFFEGVYSQMYIYDIETDRHGNLVLIGCYSGTVDFDLNPTSSASLSTMGNNTSGFVLKIFSLDFGYLWARSFNGLSSSVAYDVAVSDLGNVYVIGYFQNQVHFGSGSNSVSLQSIGFDDAFLVSYTQTGNINFVKHVASPLPTYLNFVVIDKSNRIYLGGSFSDSVISPFQTPQITSYSNGDIDYFLTRIDETGISDMFFTAGGLGLDDLQGMAITDDGAIFINGRFRSQSLNITLNNSNPYMLSGSIPNLQSTFFIAKYKLPDFSVSESKLRLKDFQLFPNPCTEICMISGLSSEVEFTITDSKGALVSKGITVGLLDIQSLSYGLYTLSFVVNNVPYSLKLLKK
jgi:hypothetical protein